VQHCIYVQALHTGLYKGPLNHNFELPIGTDRWKVAPKPWDSTTEVGKIPAGATGVYTVLLVYHQRAKIIKLFTEQITSITPF
jgi:hypothetical protein